MHGVAPQCAEMIGLVTDDTQGMMGSLRRLVDGIADEEDMMREGELQPEGCVCDRMVTT